MLLNDDKIIRSATMNQRFVKGVTAVVVGMALNYLGDKLLGVRIETFSGITTFTFAWMLDVFLVPFVVGLVVAWIFGKHAKWLACLPPLFLRCIFYVYVSLYDNPHPYVDFFFEIPLGYWGLCVILAVESANIGAILGEVMMGTYGRKDGQLGERDAAVVASRRRELSFGKIVNHKGVNHE